MGKYIEEYGDIRDIFKENGEYTDKILRKDPGPDYVLFMHFPKLVDEAQRAFTLSRYVIGTPQDDPEKDGWTKEEKRNRQIAGLYRRRDSFCP